MGVAALSTSDDRPTDRDRGPRTLCRDCEGQGVAVLPRMAVLSGGKPLNEVMATGEFLTGYETRECAACDGSGWIAGPLEM